MSLRSVQLRRSVATNVPALAFAVAALALGYLLATQVSTQSERSQLTVRYNAPLVDAAGALQKEQSDLKAQLAGLRNTLDGIQRQTATQSGLTGELSRQIDDLKVRAGLTALVGEGIVVVLDDARASSGARQDLDRSICHATDITDIVNAAWKAGAEGIAVNDERIVGTSSSYCVGSTVMVNGTLMSPPFQVAIIGAQGALLKVFDDPGELSDIKQRSELSGLGFRVARQREVRVPAFSGGIGARYASPQ